MSEWNVIHENFHTKHSVLTAPDKYMPFSYIFWAYGEHIMNKGSSRTSDQFIWLVSEKKTEAERESVCVWGGGAGGTDVDYLFIYATAPRRHYYLINLFCTRWFLTTLISSLLAVVVLLTFAGRNEHNVATRHPHPPLPAYPLHTSSPSYRINCKRCGR